VPVWRVRSHHIVADVRRQCILSALHVRPAGALSKGEANSAESPRREVIARNRHLHGVRTILSHGRLVGEGAELLLRWRLGPGGGDRPAA